MKKKALGGLLAIFVALSAMFSGLLPGSPLPSASAHHPVLSATTARECGNDAPWSATVTSESDADYNKVWQNKYKVDDGAFTAFSPFVDDQVDYVFDVGPFPATKASVLVTVTSHWGLPSGIGLINQVTETRDITIQRPATTACPKPDDKVTFSDWEDGTWECGDTTVTQTRTKTTITYVLVDFTWVEQAPVVTTETRTRDLTLDEQKGSCEEPETKIEYSEWVDGTYECDDTTVTQTRTKTVTTYTFVSGTGWVADEPVVTEESRVRDLTADELKALDEECNPPTTTTTVPDEPTTTTVPGDNSGAPGNPNRALPRTGNDVGPWALFGALMVTTGGLVLAARKRLVR